MDGSWKFYARRHINGNSIILKRKESFIVGPNCWPGIELPPANHDLIELADLFLVRGMKGSRVGRGGGGLVLSQA